MSLYQKVEQFVTDAFAKANKPTDVHHAQRTAYWIRQLQPEADEALLIAGLAHDIERAVYGDWKAGSTQPEDLAKHQQQSADEIEKFLRQVNADEAVIKRVKWLIEQHEIGGEADQDILNDADCLAYFEEKALRHAQQARQAGQTESTRQKLEHQFNRLKSEQARHIARPFYETALTALK